jgi:serine/threonine protein phosphatase PrpC
MSSVSEILFAAGALLAAFWFVIVLLKRSSPARQRNKPIVARVAASPAPTPQTTPEAETAWPVDAPREGGQDDDDDDDDKASPPGPMSPALVPPSVVWLEAEKDDVSEPVAIESFGLSDIGMSRKNNEDAFLVLSEHHTFVVADGMGGYAGGEVASRVAVETVADVVRARRVLGHEGSLPQEADEIVSAIMEANLAIYQRAQASPRLRDMGTTLLCGRFVPRTQRMYVALVGDSRCYRFRAGSIVQITVDQTLENDYGIPGPRGAHLSRAVGIRPELKADVVVDRPRRGDIYLFCSDGLSRMLKDDDLRDELAACVDLERTTRKLIRMANERGGVDNITVILARGR